MVFGMGYIYILKRERESRVARSFIFFTNIYF